jgi:hypothetical protein
MTGRGQRVPPCGSGFIMQTLNLKTFVVMVVTEKRCLRIDGYGESGNAGGKKVCKIARTAPIRAVNTGNHASDSARRGEKHRKDQISFIIKKMDFFLN